jgi:hypothetical protein
MDGYDACPDPASGAVEKSVVGDRRCTCIHFVGLILKTQEADSLVWPGEFSMY